MKTTIFLFIFMVFAVLSKAQMTINITAIPSNTPTRDEIYLAGSFNNWNPGLANYKFIKTGNIYSITLPAGNGTAEYKCTRGSWTTGEADMNGNAIGNRTFTYSTNGVINISIAGWEDKKNGGSSSTALPNVKLISNSFFIPQLNKTRSVYIYLPNDYDTALTKRYPVMYMHDGQNCFDNSTSFAGEWGVDETLSNKEKNGSKGCIVVAIYNGGASRIDEYSPYINPQYGGGQGDAYIDFIALTLKPYIDSVYRTYSNAANTAIMGSSMGGIISTYALFKYPNIFGKAGIFSPAYWFSNQMFTYALSKNKTQNQKFYFVCGKNESSSMAMWQDSMYAILKNKGYEDNITIKNVVKPEGTHSETFWKAEFGACYDWLFSDLASSSKTNDEVISNIHIYPNPTKQTVFISNPNQIIEHINLYNFESKQMNITNQITKNEIGLEIDVSKLKNGIYFVKLQTSLGEYTKRILIEN